MDEIEKKVVETVVEKSIDKAFEYVDLLIKPPLKEVGGIFADQVRYWRYMNQVKLILKVQEHHQSKGIAPQKIPVKTLANLLDAASLEENDTLKQMWVNLLANASNPNNSYDGHNTMVSLLKELTPNEAIVLNYMYKNPRRHSKQILYDMNLRDENLYQYGEEEKEKEKFIVDNLLRLNLIKYTEPVIYDSNHGGRYGKNEPDYKIGQGRDILLTDLGEKLIAECTLLS